MGFGGKAAGALNLEVAGTGTLARGSSMGTLSLETSGYTGKLTRAASTGIESLEASIPLT